MKMNIVKSFLFSMYLTMHAHPSALTATWAQSQGGKDLADFPLYKQPDEISCGPTSCAMVLKYYGKSAGIGPLKTKAGTRFYEAGTRRFGMTMPGGIVNALNAYGLSASIAKGSVDEIARLVDQDRPPILLVRSGEDTWHYVVAVGYDARPPTQIKLADPGGSAYFIDAAALNGAWQFSSDLNGKEIVARRCRTCGGEGKVAKGWTTCAFCSGTGKISGFGFSRKCDACHGKGKWTSGGVTCRLCGGDGRETDYFRKAVESAQVTGHTMIVVNHRRGGGGRAKEARHVRVGVRFANRTAGRVSFSLNGGKGMSTALNPGESGGYTMVVDEGVKPLVSISQTDGRTLPFTVSDGGDYEFRMNHGRIENAYASHPGARPTPPARVVHLAGNWSGRWSNSLGQSGADSLVLAETSDGTIAGKWSGNVPVRGRRIDATSFEMNGRTDSRSYQFRGTVQIDTITLTYKAIYINSGRTYEGTSSLKKR